MAPLVSCLLRTACLLPLHHLFVLLSFVGWHLTVGTRRLRVRSTQVLYGRSFSVLSPCPLSTMTSSSAASRHLQVLGYTASSHWNDIDLPIATGETRPLWCQNGRMFATLNNNVVTLKNDGLQLLPPATTPVALVEESSARLVNS